MFQLFHVAMVLFSGVLSWFCHHRYIIFRIYVAMVLVLETLMSGKL